MRSLLEEDYVRGVEISKNVLGETKQGLILKRLGLH